MRLHGRRSECESLDRLIAEAFAGRSGVAGTARRRRASARARSSTTSSVGYPAGTSRGPSASSRRWSCRIAGLHQLCAPMLGPARPAAGPAARRAGDGVRAQRRRGAGPVPGRPRGADACSPRRPSSSRSSASSTTRSGSTARPRRSSAFVARRLLAERVALVFAVARPASARTSLAGPARARRRRARRGDARALLLDTRPRPARRRGLRPDRRRDATATRSRCSSCRASGTPLELAGGFGLPDSRRWSGRIEQSYVQRLEALPAETRLLVLARRPSRSASRSLLRRAAADARHRHDGGRRRRRGRAARRSARACEFAHPLVRSAVYRAAAAGDRQRVHRALAEATDAEHRPGSARLAPRPRDRRARRGRRRGAGALGRPGAGARRAVAAAAAFLERAVELTPDPAPRAERALAAAQAKHRRRGARCGARRLLAIARGRAAGRAPARAGRPAARPRSRSPPAAAATRRRCCSTPPGGSSRSTSRSRARRTWTRSRRRSSPAAWPAASACARWPRPCSRAAPRARGPPRAADLLLDGWRAAHDRGLRRGARRC